MKKRHIAGAYFLGFLTCVGMVYGFGAYTTYRIHKMEAQQNAQAQDILEHSMKKWK